MIYLSSIEKSAIAQLDQETVEAALASYGWIHERTDNGIKQFRKGGAIDDQFRTRVLAFGCECGTVKEKINLLVGPFAEAEGLSALEAIAILAGVPKSWVESVK